MSDYREPSERAVVRTERPFAGLRNATTMAMAKVYRVTPRPLRPALGVMFWGITAYVSALLTIVILRLLFRERRVVDHELLLFFVGCGLVAAMVFGLAREFLTISPLARPWALAFLTSLAFWSAVLLVAGWKNDRNMLASRQDVLIFGIIVVVCGVVGGWVLSSKHTRRDDPA